jgi:hypothetical protein
VVRILDEIVASGTPYRANRALAAIKKVMSWTLDRGMIEVNPIAGLKPPHKERARERTLTDQEVSALLTISEAEGYREPGREGAPFIPGLVERLGFEVSGQHRVAIWHGGYVEAARRVDAIALWLGRLTDDGILAGVS